MTKTITLDYEEYLKLEEKANLNQSMMDKRVNKNLEAYKKILEKEYKVNEKYKLRDSILNSIKSGIKKRINSFGYVKYKDIAELLEIYK